MRSFKNIARVVKPHGKKGEVLVHPLRGLPFLLEPGMRVALTPPRLKGDRFRKVLSVAAFDGDGLVSFEGITSIGDAEGISGCYILAAVDDLDLGPLDIAFDDLIGREVEDARYGDLGHITEILETPANDVWVVSGPYGEVLLPVIEQVMTEIPESGPIDVQVLDGLISDND